MSTDVVSGQAKNMIHLYFEIVLHRANEGSRLVLRVDSIKNQRIETAPASLANLFGPLLNPVHTIVHDVASHRVLDTLNHIIFRMPEASALKDENPACFGQDIISPLQVV